MTSTDDRARALVVASSASAFVVFVAMLVVSSCAAIGDLGSYHEVDCVGASCDGGPPIITGDGGSDTSSIDPNAEGGTQDFGTIGGTLSGLLGKGLILKNNSSDDLQVNSNGAFVFPAKVRTGDPYNVTIGSLPSDPSQSCTVANGAGTMNGTNITNVQVTCETSSFSVGGTVVGLGAGTGLVLTNKGDDHPAPSNGPFTFDKKVASGAGFDVTVKTQPTGGGPCVVSGGTGTVGVADVTSIVVNCAPGTYTVGGTVTGLVGTVVLQNNGGSNLSISSNGSFAFPQTLTPGTLYNVTVATNPAYPPRAQTCTVTNGSSTMGAANVTNVTITCTTKVFTVGGNISGLTAAIVLKNNGVDDLTTSAIGPFTFATPIQSGNAYAVTVGTQPSGQTCSVTSGSGTVTNGAVTSVTVACSGGGADAGADPGIKCGAAYCNPVNQVCCLTNGTPACTDRCTGPGTAKIICDDAQDCATQGLSGLICCGQVNATTVFGIYCTSPTMCDPPHAYYCDPNIANPCPHGGTCTATTVPPGYFRCY